MTNEEKELLIDCLNFIIDYSDGGNEASRLVDLLEIATSEPIKTPYKQEYIEWRDRYFKQVDKVFQYQEYNNKTYHTKEMLYKQYEKAMKESPFK